MKRGDRRREVGEEVWEIREMKGKKDGSNERVYGPVEGRIRNI